MRAVGFVLSLCIVAAVAQSALPADVAAGFYPGRSAPVVVKPDNLMSSDAAAIFLDPSSHEYYARTSLPTITAQNVADVTLRGVGLAPVSHEWGSSSFVKNDYFDRARASVAVLVESVGDDLVNMHNLANLKNWRSTETSATLEFNSYPTSSLSLATSIASGVSPSSHGIVARSWSSRGQLVRAYTDANSNAMSPTVADILSSSFDYSTVGSLEGKPLTVSASSDTQLASAQCAHQSEIADNSYCIGNAQLITRTGASRPLTSALTFSSSQINSGILDLMGSLATVTGDVSTSASRDGITVTYPGGVATLSVSIPEQRAVLAELQYALSLASAMSTNRALASLARDDAPDYFAFTFASLTPLLERFGRQSKEFVAALHLIDALLPQLVSSMSDAYGERAVFQVVLMGTHESIRGAQDTREVTAKVSSVVGVARNVRDFFPYVYVTFSSASQLAQLCSSLAVEVAKTDYEVYCPAPEPAHYPEFMALSKSQFSLLETSTSTTSGTYSAPSEAQIQRYQITLWFSIGIAFVLAAIVYSIIYMDIKRDSLVYAQYNPMWENRKK